MGHHRGFLTVSINVHSACIAFAIVVCVCLIRVAVVWTIVTTVSDIISVIVILPGVEDEWAVVLFVKRAQ